MSATSSDSPSSVPPPDDSARALLRERDFMRLWMARFLVSLGTAAQAITMAWQVYTLARVDLNEAQSTFWVGIMGMATFLPLFFLFLIVGETADRFPRKWIVFWCDLGEMASAGILLAAALTGNASVALLIGVAFLFGISRAFRSPAGTALAPMLVPRALLPRAIAWSSLSYQTGAVAGPALAGLLLAWSTSHSYAFSAVLYGLSALFVISIRKPTKPDAQTGSRMELIREGLKYVWRNKIVFGAISLDLFAVLLGSAVALLPVFAHDILKVGPEGYGLLRAAPAVGAAAMALYVGVFPPKRRAGLIMFGGVAVYSLCTIIFGLSKSLALSLGVLAVLGAADMLSVYIRHTLIQIVTPDQMRGRVAAVSFLFIGASNELGEFESGITARIFGPIGAALFGGVAALGITGLWARLFPELRKADTLS